MIKVLARVTGEKINDNYLNTLVNHLEESWSHASHPTNAAKVYGENIKV